MKKNKMALFLAGAAVFRSGMGPRELQHYRTGQSNP